MPGHHPTRLTADNRLEVDTHSLMATPDQKFHRNKRGIEKKLYFMKTQEDHLIGRKSRHTNILRNAFIEPSTEFGKTVGKEAIDLAKDGTVYFNINHLTRGKLEKDEYVTSILNKLIEKKEMSREIVFITSHHKKTVETFNMIKKSVEMIYEHFDEQENPKRTSFFEEMAEYEREIPLQALKCCVLVYILHTKLTDEYMGFYDEEILELWRDVCITRALPLLKQSTYEYEEYWKAALCELGFYLTWAKLMQNDMRKYVRLVSKLLPPYFDDEDCKIASYLYSESHFTADEKKYLTKYHETTYYQKAFLGKYGLYGAFFMHLELIVGHLFLTTTLNQDLLCDDFFAFHMDVRSTFMGMTSMTNSFNQEILRKTMHIGLAANSDKKGEETSDYCVCGKLGSGLFFTRECRSDTNPPQEPCDMHHHGYKDVLWCNKSHCMYAYILDMTPDTRSLVFEITRAKRDTNKQRVAWARARDTLNICTMLTELACHQNVTFNKTSTGGRRCLGFFWLHWNDPVDEKIRFCWNCYKLGKLYLCASCRQARYCSSKCVEDHWQTHKPFCIFMAVFKSPRKYRMHKYKRREREFNLSDVE